MVEGFGPERDAVVASGACDRESMQSFLGNDDAAERGYGEEGGRGGFTKNALHGMPGNEERGSEETDARHQRGESLRLSMAIWMLMIGLPTADAQAVPDNQRRDTIGEGLDAVGDEGIGGARKTHDYFEGREGNI